MKGNERHFVLVDSIGPDELRLTFKGTQLSKQNLRNSYKNSNWKKAPNKNVRIFLLGKISDAQLLNHVYIRFILILKPFIMKSFRTIFFVKKEN